jgi:hypothetical protein
VLSNAQIYEILCKIKNQTPPPARFYNELLVELEQPATDEQLAILAVELRYIYAPGYDDAYHLDKAKSYSEKNLFFGEGVPFSDPERRRWEITASGHQFMTIYESLFEASRIPHQPEEQIQKTPESFCTNPSPVQADSNPQ